MKVRMMIILLGLLLAMPGLTSANVQVPAENEKPAVPGSHDKEGEKDGKECEDHNHKNWQAKMAEREQKLLGWVDQYTPDKKAEWTKVLAEKKEIRNKWLSPENAAKREKVEAR